MAISKLKPAKTKNLNHNNNENNETKTPDLKLEVFEGPLDLLIHLVEKNKIDIYNIQLSVITEQYLEYLRAMRQFDIEIASEFLVMAAKLIQLKSRLLLPVKVSCQEQDEEEIEDLEQELADKLVRYREFKQAAAIFAQMAKERGKSFTRPPQKQEGCVKLPAGLVLDNLILAFAGVIESFAPEYALVAREEISVNDKMQDILFLLKENNGRLEFAKTIFRWKNLDNRVELIASFLAVLELIRLKKIAVSQETGFSPIILTLIEKS